MDTLAFILSSRQQPGRALSLCLFVTARRNWVSTADSSRHATASSQTTTTIKNGKTMFCLLPIRARQLHSEIKALDSQTPRCRCRLTFRDHVIDSLLGLTHHQCRRVVESLKPSQHHGWKESYAGAIICQNSYQKSGSSRHILVLFQLDPINSLPLIYS